MDEGTQTGARDQVLEAKRWAWAGKLTAGRAEYFYDGIELWRRSESNERRATPRAPSSWMPSPPYFKRHRST